MWKIVDNKFYRKIQFFLIKYVTVSDKIVTKNAGFCFLFKSIKIGENKYSPKIDV